LEKYLTDNTEWYLPKTVEFKTFTPEELVENEYFMNWLRWMTNYELDDEILKKTRNWRVENDNFVCDIEAIMKAEDWRCCYGSTVK
jgi:hypothetical protein